MKPSLDQKRGVLPGGKAWILTYPKLGMRYLGLTSPLTNQHQTVFLGHPADSRQ